MFSKSNAYTIHQGLSKAQIKSFAQTYPQARDVTVDLLRGTFGSKA
jgi:hypothetical protein